MCNSKRGIKELELFKSDQEYDKDKFDKCHDINIDSQNYSLCPYITDFVYRESYLVDFIDALNVFITDKDK